LFLLALFLLIRTSARIHPQLPTVLLLIVAAWFLWDFSAAARRCAKRNRRLLIWSRGIALLGDLFDAIAKPHAHFAMTKPSATICFLIADRRRRVRIRRRADRRPADAPPARRLSCHRHARIRRDHPRGHQQLRRPRWRNAA
jgi:hypothetical protein